MRKKALVVAVLLMAATVTIYVAALSQSISAYETWKQMRLEETPPSLRPFMDFAPYINSLHGTQMILAGALITLGWLTAAIILSKGKLKYY